MITCDNCSEAVPTGAAFCPKCGVALGNEPTPVDGRIIESSPPDDTSERQSFPRAHMGKRIMAGLIDVGIVFALVFPLYRLGALRTSMRWQIIPFILPCIYLLFKDGIMGRSIGKWLTGLVTYNVRSRKTADLADSVIRNWFLVIVVMPPRIYIFNVGMLLFAALALIIFLQIMIARKQRLGDAWANTQVIDSALLKPKGGA